MASIKIAEKAGFCFGVRKAVETVYREAEEARGEVYTYGPIIHNEEVVKDLERKGVRVLDGPEALRALRGGTVIIRSHGIGREIYEICEKKQLRVVDATCPFVAKIHRIVQEENAKGRQVIIVGDPAHPEVMGIRGWGRKDTEVIESAEDFEALGLEKGKSISIVAQTTYNLTKFKKILDKITDLGYDIACFNTICNATQERQTEAGRIASEVDAMIVIGGQSSSNTRKLAEICSAACENTFFVQTADDLDPKVLASFERIGITAGASTPKHIIEEVQTIVRSEF
ncbi:4-hydroxy-3-methylbut-2-enyl diphosphate reductase [Fusobacterium naviforme]|nr:4-hydroxy-3-methylbut-2-enyl diphosphate reductase [Fusobacterium naviforme]PSL09583.1 4-hydroxy-3-methylbut-2-enyl diphosphate reductase [Fusobacterium naviforme]STO27425.1 4-hydroxy-3-methylbut-2-enyl diphosphate reductase [Fusobacterium naviforme]